MLPSLGQFYCEQTSSFITVLPGVEGPYIVKNSHQHTEVGAVQYIYRTWVYTGVSVSVCLQVSHAHNYVLTPYFCIVALFFLFFFSLSYTDAHFLSCEPGDACLFIRLWILILY